MNFRKFSVFTALNDFELQQVASGLRIKNIDAQQVICRKGDEADGMYFLTAGHLKIIETTEDGREIELGQINPGNFFGELSVIDNLPRSADIVATQYSTIGFLPQSSARTLFYKIPALAEAMMSHLAKMVRSTTQQLGILSIPNTYQRICAHIIQLPRTVLNGQIFIENFPKQQSIATILNTSRETVSRTISSLENKGVISKKSKTLYIHKIDLLQNFAQSGSI